MSREDVDGLGVPNDLLSSSLARSSANVLRTMEAMEHKSTLLISIAYV